MPRNLTSNPDPGPNPNLHPDPNPDPDPNPHQVPRNLTFSPGGALPGFQLAESEVMHPRDTYSPYPYPYP